MKLYDKLPISHPDLSSASKVIIHYYALWEDAKLVMVCMLCYRDDGCLLGLIMATTHGY